jgi:dTDP-4-amino-4,6-dideoxygalactose transaminase
VTQLRDEDVEAVLETLRSGWLTMGPRIQDFEQEFAGWSGAAHAVACSSGTAALHLALLAERLDPGEPVTVPALGGRAAAEAVRHCGGRPVFADVVAAERPVLDPDAVRTRLAVAVHLHGHDAGPAAVHDCRAAVAARPVGTACFSFADGRQLPMGEGGMVTTADEDVAARVRLLRAHAMTSGTWDRHRGHSDSYDVVDVGFNFRLDEPRAALGSSRMRRLAEDLAAARAVAREWAAAVPAARPARTPGAFPVLVAGRAARDRAVAALRAAGFSAWTEPLLDPSMPRAREAAERLVVVGLDPAGDAERLAAAFR